jgi:hypothetical protein
MKAFTLGFSLLTVFSCAQTSTPTAHNKNISRPNNLSYSWVKKAEYSTALVNRFKPLKGFTLVKVKKVSYEEWLRFLPMEPKKQRLNCTTVRRNCCNF